MQDTRGLSDADRSSIKSLLFARPTPSTNKPSRRTSAGLWVKPFASDALGVNPVQIDQARAEMRKHGIAAEYDSQGRFVATSEKNMHDVAKVRGIRTGRDGYEPQMDDGRPAYTGTRGEDKKQEFLKEMKNLIREQDQNSMRRIEGG